MHRLMQRLGLLPFRKKRAGFVRWSEGVDYYITEEDM
jgi:hypothetical protein